MQQLKYRSIGNDNFTEITILTVWVRYDENKDGTTFRNFS